jgi:YegS/Rv2252/BmrU family lipid kinase
MDVAVILNPRAGHGADDERQAEIISLFAAHGRQATVFVPAKGHDIGQRARAAVSAGCRLLVAGGGDGTVNAVASAVVGQEIPLGVLPVGTLNHFAKDVGIPLDLPEAVRVAAQGVLRRVDVGEVNGRYFLNNSSLGVYPRIVELRERYRNTVRNKWIAALWASLAVLRRRPFVGVRIHVEGETEVRRTPLVFIGNNEYVMEGLRGVHRASLTEGILAVYVMRGSRRTSLLGLGAALLLRGVERVRELDLFRTPSAAVETRRERIHVALDGEVTVMRSPLEYRSLPAALGVMAPGP